MKYYLILLSIVFLSSCFDSHDCETCVHYEAAEIYITEFNSINIVTESLDTTYSMTHSPLRFNFLPTTQQVEITSRGQWILMETKEVLVDNCNYSNVQVDFINQYKMILNLDPDCWNSTIGSGNGYFLTFIMFCEP